MTDIKRWNVESDEQDGPCSLWYIDAPDGDFVKYDDHAAIVAALQEQVQQLAAENVNIKRVILEVANGSEECEFNGDEHRYVVIPEDFDALIDLMGEVPNTDAVIRDIGAKAVAPYIEALPKLAGSFLDRAMNASGKISNAYSLCAHEVALLDKELRAGEQP